MKKGFTLIELLVVISIIGILASLTLVSYSGAQKQARDTQRKSDLAQVRNALENFAAINSGFYPERITRQSISANLCTDLGTTLLASCPSDPGSYTYAYESNNTGGGGGAARATSYVLDVKLETTGGYWEVCSNGKSGKTVCVGKDDEATCTVGITAVGSCP